MEYTPLGPTGMRVSRICLGCLSFGTAREWMVGPDESADIVETALDLGINFFDTSNVYSGGESERFLGDALSGHDRDRLVVATKVFNRTDEHNPNSEGLSRKAIEQELDKSLDRLGLETVDLYQIHRWDYETPIEETLRAFNGVIRRGKVRAIGVSSMWAHQLAEALAAADRLGLPRFATMQNHYNLAYREEEREVIPLCRKEGLGLIPYSPLARGYLARPHDQHGATVRGDAEPGMRGNTYPEGGGQEINARVAELAENEGVSMAQIAIAWVLAQDGVDAPIVGATRPEHVEQAAEAIELDLSASDVEYLAEPYEPSPIWGHR